MASENDLTIPHLGITPKEIVYKKTFTWMFIKMLIAKQTMVEEWLNYETFIW